MINFNGNLVSDNELIFNSENRAFKYGDGVFDTLKIVDSKIVFSEEHYFRLMASMRILRMEIPSDFTLEFFENQILVTAKSNNLEINSRIRMTIYRGDGGLYNPTTNDINFVIEASPLNVTIKEKYTVDLFKDFYVYSGFLSTLKTTNRILNVVASVYASENEFDTCLLVNENKNLVEAIHGNIFLVFDNKIVTPSVECGCIKGIIRKKTIELISKKTKYTIEERIISPFELQKADELFITNSVLDLQPITNYRKKEYKTEIGNELLDLIRNEYA